MLDISKSKTKCCCGNTQGNLLPGFLKDPPWRKSFILKTIYIQIMFSYPNNQFDNLCLLTDKEYSYLRELLIWLYQNLSLSCLFSICFICFFPLCTCFSLLAFNRACFTILFNFCNYLYLIFKNSVVILALLHIYK